MKMLTHLFIYLCSALLLISCTANKQLKPASATELKNLSEMASYQFSGKMSFSDGHEGGSGQVDWYKSQAETKLLLKAPLSKKSWELIERNDGAQIKLSDGEVIYGTSAKTLLSEQLGWEVPWGALKLWVTGQKTPRGQVVKSTDGVQYLDQGWQIKYLEFKAYDDQVLPYKITARKGNHSIKLIIKQWQW